MLEEKAKDLGRQIGQSTEYQALKRSNDLMLEDAEAATMLGRMTQLRGDAQQFIERGEDPPQEMEQELDAILQKVELNPAYQRAIVAHLTCAYITRVAAPVFWSTTTKSWSVASLT